MALKVFFTTLFLLCNPTIWAEQIISMPQNSKLYDGTPLSKTTRGVNNALRFDGVVTRVELKSNALFSGTDNFSGLPEAGKGLTVSLWIKPEKNRATVHGAGIFSNIIKNDQVDPELFKTWSGYQLVILNDSLVAEVSDINHWADRNSWVKPKAKLKYGEWQHIALSIDFERSRVEVFLNGKLDSSNYIHRLNKSKFKSNTGLVLGTDKDNIWHYSGLMDQLMIWDIPMREEQISKVYKQRHSGRDKYVRALYTFDNGYPEEKNHYWDTTKILLESKALGKYDVYDYWGLDGKLINFDLRKPVWVNSDLELESNFKPFYAIPLGHIESGPQNYLPGVFNYFDRPVPENASTPYDKHVAFYGSILPDEGTVPVFGLKCKGCGTSRLLTMDSSQRHHLETDEKMADVKMINHIYPRPLGNTVPLHEYRNKTGLIGYAAENSPVAATLKESKSGYHQERVVGHVPANPNIPVTYKKLTAEAIPGQISQGIWYVITPDDSQRKHLGLTWHTIENKGLWSKIKWGVGFHMDKVPKTGDYDKFLWRIEKDPEGHYRLINKARNVFGRSTWSLSNSNSNGTDEFLIKSEDFTSYSDKPPSYGLTYAKGSGLRISKNAGRTIRISTRYGLDNEILMTDAKSHPKFKFVAMELVDGYVIPAPANDNRSIAYNKHLVTSLGVNIYGTATVSEWAMLRAWYILENMTRLVNPTYKKLSYPVDVIIMSKDDTAEMVTRYPLLNVTESSEKNAEYRGFANKNIALITEEMMAKTGVKSRGDTRGYRLWNQLIHEFAHVLDRNLGMKGGETPSCPIPNSTRLSKAECFAIATELWFATEDSSGLRTRKNLKKQPALYKFIADRFQISNTWAPPEQLRERY